MINGSEHSYESIELMLNGKLVSATGIKYTTKRDIEAKYVLGQTNPAAMIKGKKESSGEITLEHNEIIRLQNSIPKGADFTDIKGMIAVVTYQDADNMLYTDRLVDVMFEEHPKDFKAENSHFEVTLPVKIGNILYNV